MLLTAYLKRQQALINRSLATYLPAAREVPGSIHQAMRYSVLGEGKRIRPILALAAAEAVGGKVASVLPAACALELIHAYSLVHDDLPAMDNDDFRRGKPSCHKQFGEAIGVLTGDALLTYAFELLSQGNGSAASIRLHVIQEVAQAIGTRGMIGGQVADVEAVRKNLSSSDLQYIHTHKTGALLGASVRIGALLGGATASQYRMLSRYGDRIGLVFQLVDDLLDDDGAVKLYGPAAVRKKAERLTEEATAVLSPLKARGRWLRELASFILRRGS